VFWGFDQENTLVTRLEGENVYETAIMWTDCRNGERGISLQVIDAEGGYKFEDEGRQVVFQDGMHPVSPYICPSVDGGWFIAWNEEFLGADSSRIWVTKINSDGENIWGGEQCGIVVVESDREHEYILKLIEDQQGGCLLFQQGYPDGPFQILAQHFDAGGVIVENWGRNGNVLINRRDGFSPEVIQDDGGGAIAVWNLDNSTIRAQKITSDGQLPWGGGGVEILSQSWFDGSVTITKDGNGGAFIGWVDSRFDDRGVTSIFAQHINSEGGILWQENGELISEDDDREYRNCLSIGSLDNSVIINWDAGDEVRSARIAGEDELNVVWRTGGLWDENDFWGTQICTDGDGGIYKYGNSRFQHLDSEGGQYNERGIDFEWPVRSTSIAVRPSGMIGVYSEYSGGGEPWYFRGEIQAKQLVIDGNRYSLEEPVTIIDRFIARIHDIGMPINLESNGEGMLVLNWEEYRPFRRPVYQLINTTGNQPEFHLEENGRMIRDDQYWNGPFDITIDEEGYIYTAYARDNDSFIVFQKINPQGENEWGENGIQLREDHGIIGRLNIEKDNQGGIYFAYTYWVDFDECLVIQRLGTNGEFGWEAPGVVFNEIEVIDQIELFLLEDPGINIIWDGFYEDHFTRSTAINRGGEILWGGPDEYVEISDWWLSNPISARHPEGVICVWLQENEIRGQFINNDGTLRWRDESVVIAEVEDIVQIDVDIDNDGNIWVAARNGNVIVQKISSEAHNNRRAESLLGEENGLIFCEVSYSMGSVQIVHDGNNGVWLVWGNSAARGRNFDSDIYATHINENGNPIEGWSRDGRAVCDAFGAQYIAVAEPIDNSGESGIAVAWIDERTSYSGIWTSEDIYIQHIDDDIVSVPELAANPPVDFQLYKPYPNPFNSSTTIEYALPFESDVTLNLYNLYGQRVETLVSGRMQAGVHQVMLDAGDLASGLYFLKLEGVGQSVAQKIMLIK